MFAKSQDITSRNESSQFPRARYRVKENRNSWDDDDLHEPSSVRIKIVSSPSRPSAQQLQKLRSNESHTDDASELKGKRDRRKGNVEGPLPILFTTGWVLLIFLLVKYMDTKLPMPLLKRDHSSYPDRFIEERAREDLHELTKLGPRISGTAMADVTTVNALLDILQGIGNSTSGAYGLQYEAQRPSGAFWLEEDGGHTSSYSKISNVVAKLWPKDPTSQTNSGILFCCHFDSKWASSGGSDDMISCSVMLEVIRVLSSQEDIVFRNPLIFLFEGAEELGFQGAHGFVGGRDPIVDDDWGHEWSKNLKAFVNLEGAGGGGREMLFQTTGGHESSPTGWILKAYRQSPHPYGTVLGEEVFDLGLIPSDTDFRIFRDFLGLPGLDMAYIKNGWVYHTKWDRASEIPTGSMQHMGDNVLSIAKYFGNLDFSDDRVTQGSHRMVFFDVLGVVMISYSKEVGIAINVLVSIATILGTVLSIAVRWGWPLQWVWNKKSFIKLGILFGTTLLSWTLAFGVTALIATVFTFSGYKKPFYSYPTLAIIIFGVPAILTHILVCSICLKGSQKKAWHSATFTLAVILLPATVLTRAAYLLMVPLLFGVFAWFTPRHFLRRRKPAIMMVVYIVFGETVPIMLGLYSLVSLTDIFVPILGRSGELDGNLFMGLAVTGFLCVITFSRVLSFLVGYNKWTLLTCLLISIFLLNPLLVFGFIGKIPYQEKTPMRFTAANVDRMWYDEFGSLEKEDGAFWYWNIDGDTNEMLDKISQVSVPEFRNIDSVTFNYEECEDLNCAHPFAWPTTWRINKANRISKNEALPDAIRDAVNMNVFQRHTNDSTMERTFILDFIGSSHTAVVLSPKKGWSAKVAIRNSEGALLIQEPGEWKWKERDTFTIFHSRGFELGESLVISIELQGNPEEAEGGDDQSLLSIQFISFYFERTGNTTTPEFTDLLNRFPSWVFTDMSWSCVMKLYRLI